MVDKYTEQIPSVVPEETLSLGEVRYEQKRPDYSAPLPLDERKPAQVSNVSLPPVVHTIPSPKELKLEFENNFLKLQLARAHHELKRLRGVKNKKFQVSQVNEETLKDERLPGKENFRIKRLLSRLNTPYYTIY